MLTIFTTFKPSGEIYRQTNAITSWTLLEPRPEIILFGDEEHEPGMGEIAEASGSRYVGDIERSDRDTPLLNSLFTKAQECASHGLLCYVNADIILMQDFVEALKKVSARFDRFLMVGRRWDWNNPRQLEFSDGWQGKLEEMARRDGKLFAPAADWFAFTKGLWGHIPPLAVGRYWWDPWLMWDAMRRGVPVVDATEAVLSVHQRHGRSITPDHPEARMNLASAHEAQAIDMDSAPWALTKEEILEER